MPGLPQARSDTQQVRCAAAMAMTTDHCSGESGFSSDNIHPEAELGGHPAPIRTLPSFSACRFPIPKVVHR